jgi:hypothetical protein
MYSSSLRRFTERVITTTSWPFAAMHCAQFHPIAGSEPSFGEQE